MSLITLPAFLTRRKETAMTDATTVPEAADDVVMRFLTHGGAEVHVLRDRLGIRCQGCDHERASHAAIGYARDNANDHAAACRAMPKSGA